MECSGTSGWSVLERVDVVADVTNECMVAESLDENAEKVEFTHSFFIMMGLGFIIKIRKCTYLTLLANI